MDSKLGEGVPSQEALEAAHTFPGEYTIKIIGHNQKDFIAATRDVCLGVVGEENILAVNPRNSERGNHLALTLRLKVQSAEEVQRVYQGLKKVPGVLFLI